MTFVTAEYSPPEHTPPGWTREQFMDYFAGVVEVPRFPPLMMDLHVTNPLH